MKKVRKLGSSLFSASWHECWQEMQRILLHSYDSEESLSEDDFLEAVWRADALVQCYLSALRQRVPNELDSDRFQLCLNKAEKALLNHASNLNAMLCEMAQAGRRNSCEELWNQAVGLTQTFNELALRYPDFFKNKARQSLFMPSLRVPPTLRRSKKGREKWTDEFLGETPDIARAVELSAESVSAKLKDNRTQLGARCAQLVGECVHEIKRSRHLWTQFFTSYKVAVSWPTLAEIQPCLGKSMDELVAMIPPPSRDTRPKDDPTRHVRFFSMLAECGSERLHFLLLPELTAKTARTWWKDAIEKMVEARFSSLLQNPGWTRELKAVSSGTKADMLKELKDYSQNKVKQFG